MVASSSACVHPCGYRKSREAMPTSSALRFLLRTYTWEAGSSPTRITASVGGVPVDSAGARQHRSSLPPAPWPRPPCRRGSAPAARAQAGTGTRRRSMDRPRPVSGSMRITTPWSAAGPLAGSKRFGIWVEEALERELGIDADDRVGRPGHPEIGDVGGALRQQRARPPSARGGAYRPPRSPVRRGTSPSPAIPRSPRSACRRRRSASPGAGAPISSSALRNGQSRFGRKTRPIRLSTPTLWGPALRTIEPAPGAPAGKLAGRSSRFSLTMYSMISFLSQM